MIAALRLAAELRSDTLPEVPAPPAEIVGGG